MNIWIIDDNRALLELLVATMQEHGIVTEGFGSAQEVLHCMDRRWLTPDVVIMDWTLPDVPAAQVLDAVTRYAPQARIAVMSGDFDIESQLPQGAVWFGKPFRLDAFFKMVTQLASMAG